MKLLKRLFLGLAIIVLLALLYVLTFVDNPITEYIKSDIFSMKNDTKLCSNSMQLNLIQLDSLIKNKPNSVFAFFSYHCGVSYNMLEKGSSYDSLSKRSTYYISTDNRTAIKKICEVIFLNSKIDTFYYLEDPILHGIHFTRGQLLFEQFAPEKDRYQKVGSPFKLYSNSKGIIDSSSQGNILIK